MQIFKMEKLPQSAGGVPIKWDSEVIRPLIKEGSIFISDVPNGEYYPLKNGEQLLYVDYFTYFGGMDEKAPFMTRLDPRAFNIFRAKGEQAFYQCLKPRIIQQAEKAWGEEGTERQGDIFVYPLPYPWKELSFRARMHELLWRCGLEEEVQIFGTRHTAQGNFPVIKVFIKELGEIHSWPRSRLRGSEVAVGEGTLRAPNHEPLVLKGSHLLARSPMVDWD